MTNTERLAVLKDRLGKLNNSPKNIKCPGVTRKIRREIRNLEKTL